MQVDKVCSICSFNASWLSKMTPRLRAPLENGMPLWPTHSEEGRSIPGAEPVRRNVLSSFNWSLFWATQTFTSEMQDSMVRVRVVASEGESVLYSSVSSANIWSETEWWLITSERGWVCRMKRTGPWAELWGLHKSEAKEILLHLQLLLVSCLACRNRRTTKQDHKYQKRFRGESEGCYDR